MKAVDDRGIKNLVSKNQDVVNARIEASEQYGLLHRQSFDPVIVIITVVTEALVAILMTSNRLNDLSRMAQSGGCPLCFMNKVHDSVCSDAHCKLIRESAYDCLISEVADFSLEQARLLKLAPLPC